MKTPVLKEVDMSKADGHECQEIELNKLYLVKHHGQFMVGQFNRVWFGLNFHPNYGHNSFQFDAPGTNASSWEAIWEFIC